MCHINQSRAYTKITSTINDTENYCITNHLHVILSHIYNCFMMNVLGSNEKQYFPKLLLQVSGIDIHNNMVQPVSRGVLSESRGTNNNVIISYLKPY